MMETGNSIALITARGGSKRLPGKNIKLLAGKPLIAWTIEAALAARAINRVIVSTDDEGIANVARRAGAEVPFLRPDELSGDHSSHYAVIDHALDWLELDNGRLPALMCLLQPTSPLRNGDDIDALVGMVETSGADCGVAVAQARIHPAYMYRLEATGVCTSYLPKGSGYLRSQDLEPLYYVNGATYVFRPATFRDRESVLSDSPVGYVMPSERAIDIDDEHDFFVAEAMVNSRSA